MLILPQWLKLQKISQMPDDIWDCKKSI